MKKKMVKRKRGMTRNQKMIFPLLLAALCSKPPNRKTLIMKCLKRLFLSLPHVHLPPILSLLPSLLKFNCVEIVRESLEFIGAASLASFEMNEKIALEDQIVKGLISLLGSSEREIGIAACNSMLDLSTTSIGRERLLELDAILNLLFCFIQESESLVKEIALSADMTFLKEDEFLVLLLQGAITLINSSTIEQLQQIPRELSEKILVCVKRLWGRVHRQGLISSSGRSDPGHRFSLRNIRMNTLAESVFRLSINYDPHPISLLDCERIQKSIFCFEGVDLELFLSEIWEMSPRTVRNGSMASLMHDGIFSPFIQYLGQKEGILAFLSSMLESIISCPAITSDKLDVLDVIGDIKDQLGSPMIYRQDIRVMKTQEEKELHYFQEESGSGFLSVPHVFSANDIIECKEAFRNGYSIALRGLEYRYHSISAIAGVLASLFGQPSVGVNMYLTPSNSQGLARHSDDHCVLICQLIGSKKWSIFPRPRSQLPRLYECFDTLQDANGGKGKIDSCQQFLLKEGDILYIPRGFPHEAKTEIDDENGIDTAGFSLHLTFAIEIEPPFECEGFMHVALYTWDMKQRATLSKSGEFALRSQHSSTVKLLHVAITLIGILDPVFRKACLVGANPFSPDTEHWLFNNQRTLFAEMINKIANTTKFSHAFEHLETAIQKNEDPLEHLRWMNHLMVECEDIYRPQVLTVSSTDSMHQFDVLIQDKTAAEASFMQVKSRFCNEVEFEDVEKHYKSLLERYRKVRKQYVKGMLSLHSALHNELEMTWFK